MFTRTTLTFAVSAVCALALFGLRAQADIIGTTGAALFNGTDGPASSAVPDGPGQNNKILYAWNEQLGVTLGSAITPDMGGMIAAGSLIDSHMLRFDPETSGSAIGTVTFDGPILGIMTTRDGLDATDFLGSPGTTYPSHPSAALRGLEPGDFLSVVGTDTVLARWTASSPGDQIRVLTAHVPEPGTFALFGSSLVGLGVLCLKQRRAKGSVKIV